MALAVMSLSAAHRYHLHRQQRCRDLRSLGAVVRRALCGPCGQAGRAVVVAAPPLLTPHADATRSTMKRQLHGAQARPPVFWRAPEFGGRVALRDQHAEYTYAALWRGSRRLAARVTDALAGRQQQRVAFLCPNDASYVMALWACWISGQIAVPLSPLHPESSMRYFVRDSEAGLLIASEAMRDQLAKAGQGGGQGGDSPAGSPALLVLDDEARRQAAADKDAKLTEADKPKASGTGDEGNALIIYTSGTTNLPKGVLLSHGNLAAQVHALLEAWRIGPDDHLLHALPLHHMHGIVNALLCPLTAGAKITMLPKFSASRIWSEMLSTAPGRVNVFMAVPTSYAKLLDEYRQSVGGTEQQRKDVRDTMRAEMRLMASGSAPLPVPLFEQWERVTGHRLLERFGMSETGMVLSNPLEPQSARRPGFVGHPLPAARVRLVRPATDTDDEKVLCEGDASGTDVLVRDGQPVVGHLLVKGPNVFAEYWRKPEATAKEFTKDGWFRTGDTCEFADGAYKILGRTSVDIIKTGGYKVSAVQVETCLLGHPDIEDCAVVGVADDTWGQTIAAVARLRPGASLELDALRQWGRDKLPPYSLPRVLRVVEQVPRNPMGKVNKKTLVEQLFADKDSK